MPKQNYHDENSSNESKNRSQGEDIEINEVEIDDFDKIKKQSSILTIFSIWNTTVGSSLLTMPWAMQISGFVLGGLTLVIMGLMSFYTIALILRIPPMFKKLHPNNKLGGVVDYSNVVKYYLGKTGFLVSNIFSTLAFFGALVVFFVLICDFSFNIVEFIHHQAIGQNSTVIPLNYFNRTWENMICQPDFKNVSSQLSVYNPLFNSIINGKKENLLSYSYSGSVYEILWDRNYTVPFYIMILLVLISYFGTTSFLSKFNAFGIISTLYLIVFVIVKCYSWGLVNFDINSNDPLRRIKIFSPGFYRLTGISLLAYFIHNAIPFIMKAQKNPKHNVRDAGIAFSLIIMTYLVFGLGIFIFFPLPKQCLFDNILDNFSNYDILCTTCRISLSIQLITVYPLALNILFRQFFLYFLSIPNPNNLLKFSTILLLTTLSCIFAVFYPSIGSIIGFVGALCGLIYSIAVPCICKIMIDREIQGLSKEELNDLECLLEESDETTNCEKVEEEDVQVTIEKHSKLVYYLMTFGHISLIIFGLINLFIQFYPLPTDE